MPIVWLRHDKRQLFLNVAILTAAEANAVQTGAVPKPPQMFKALVDTGAMGTCVTVAAAAKLGLSPIGKVAIQGVSGVKYHNNFLFHVGFLINLGSTPDPSLPPGQQLVTQELHVLPSPIQGAEFDAGSAGFDVLLGMDVISTGNLTVGSNGTFSWTW